MEWIGDSIKIKSEMNTGKGRTLKKNNNKLKTDNNTNESLIEDTKEIKALVAQTFTGSAYPRFKPFFPFSQFFEFPSSDRSISTI